MRREDDGVCPLKAVLVVLHTLAVDEFRPDRDDLALARLVVVAVQGVPAAGGTADRAGEDDVGVVGMDRYLPALRASDEVAVGIEDSPLLDVATGSAYRAVVLLRRIHAIGIVVVGVHPVELRCRLIVDRRPRVPVVEGHAGPAVVPLYQALRVRGVDPQVVVVAVRHRHLVEGAPSVGRLPALEVQDPHGLGVLGIAEYVAVVPRPLDELRIARYELPRLAQVVGPVETPVLGLDDRPNATFLRGGDGDAHATLDAPRKPLVPADALPRVPAVRRPV